MKDLLGRLVGGVVLGLELAYLGSVLWRRLNPDAPSLAELVERSWSELETRAQYRLAIAQTFRSIRNLPETEPE